MSENYYNSNMKTREKIIRRFSMFDGTGSDLRNTSNYEEALNEAEINYSANKKPIYLADGSEISGHFATVKSDSENTVLGIVGEQYTPIDNKTAFSVCEELQKAGWGFEVGGPSLGSQRAVNYAKSFLVMRGEDFNVGEDPYNTFAIFNNSYDGSTGVICRIITQRVWCMNGCVRYLGGAKSQLQIAIQHSKTVNDRLAVANKIMLERVGEIKEIKREAEAFIGIKMSKKEFEDEIIPLILKKKRLVENDKDRERGAERVAQVVSQLCQAYEADDTQNYNNTAYKVILALQDFETHATPLRDTQNPHLYMNNIMKGMILTTAVAQHIAQTRGINLK